MRISTSCLIAAILAGSMARAESLADAAKREQERREKNKKEGVASKVIDADELARTATTKDSKGAFNGGNEGDPQAPQPPSSSASLLAGESSPKPKDDRAERELVRRAAADLLEQHYKGIARVTPLLISAANTYGVRCSTFAYSRTCQDLLINVQVHARTVSYHLSRIEGIVGNFGQERYDERAERERHGVSRELWEDAVRLSAKYR